MESQEIISGVPFSSSKKNIKRTKDKNKKSDYGWLPPWGLITEKTFKQFYKNKKTKFTMKDKSIVHLCKVSDLVDMINSNTFSWVIDNPGIFYFKLKVKKT